MSDEMWHDLLYLVTEVLFYLGIGVTIVLGIFLALTTAGLWLLWRDGRWRGKP